MDLVAGGDFMERLHMFLCHNIVYCKQIASVFGLFRWRHPWMIYGFICQNGVLPVALVYRMSKKKCARDSLT